ncbi:hypothetical protein D307_gp118 [Bacillus phage Bastille]|uniref:Uncharacterized protein n=2 Tax=Bastillevirus TaxID=1918010 RepID=A0A024B175_9CAUD|nr:hypothetical protein D307_gp118 [Bacillus phage Bastille]YP_009035738.1 hypothetical protein FP76_gp153 [Bacillus phage Evoli]ASR79673.1 hypothetical protein OTK52_219 [Bacillus phage OTooleKemple52]AXQ67118.1 hypothetical protein KAMFAM_221 [Bacillus phage Kamfam]AEQ34346.1 hypothetical protein [Bacillus phage Bastille]AHZ09941.1 hypothetical protein [Bacillus phage Evoli]
MELMQEKIRQAIVALESASEALDEDNIQLGLGQLDVAEDAVSGCKWLLRSELQFREEN